MDTRNRILDAAEIRFHIYGVARTSLADIAQAADVTRGAVYWHFKDKSDLFNAMCERVRLPMERMVIATVADSESNPLGQLRAACIFILRETAQNPHFYKVLDIVFHKCEFVNVTAPIKLRQEEGFLHGTENIVRILFDAIERGQLRQDVDAQLGAIIFHAALSGIIKNWLFSPASFDLAGNAETLVNTCIETLEFAPSLRNMKVLTKSDIVCDERS